MRYLPTYEMRVYEIPAHDMLTYEMSAYDMPTYEMPTYDVHAYRICSILSRKILRSTRERSDKEDL
jgi:hypothetical protein